MKISSIKKIGNTNRYNIYTDEKWCGVFLDEILAKYEIRTGNEVEEDRFKIIKEENDEKVSFDMAVTYLEKYVVSRKGLKDYLKKKAFSVKVIEKTLAKLQEYGFVDDERFAKNYFESLSQSKGKRAIASKLKEKGISSEIVDVLLENVDIEFEIEKATALVEKFVKNRQIDTKIKQKCLAHLIYKGYDYSVAQQATKNALNDKQFTDKGENYDWI